MSRQSVATTIANYLTSNLGTSGLGKVEKYMPKLEPEHNTATGIVWVGRDTEKRVAFKQKHVKYTCRVIVMYPQSVSTDADAQAAQGNIDGVYDKIKALLRNDQTMGGAQLQAGEESLDTENAEPILSEDGGTIILGGYVEFIVTEFIVA